MSDKPERVFTGSSKNPTEYVRKDIVQEMLEQQREEIETLKAEMQTIIRTVVIHQDIEEASKLALTARSKYGLDGATGENDE